MNTSLGHMKAALTVLSLFVVAVFSGCSGGGGGGTPPPSSNPTVVKGVVSKGPLNGSTVCAYAITSGAMGAQIGSCSTTDSAGNYNLNLETYTGPVLLQATGGTYVNEATGATATLTSPLRSMLSNASSGSSSVAVTALTELAYQNATALAGGLTNANIQSAVAKVQNNFGVSDIVGTMPVDALNIPASATAEQKTHALALATISQYLKGMPTGSSLADGLQTMQTCLAAPTTGCGTGASSVGALLNTAQTTFAAGHSTFSGMTLPVIDFGSVTPKSTLSITSIDNNSPSPFTVLHIGTSGLNPNAATTVTFSDSAQYSVTLSAIRVASNGTVVVGTPIYVNGTTGAVGSGTVSVVVSQGNQSTNSTTISIQNLPTLAQLGIPVGQMSHSFYVFATQVIANRIQQLDELSVLLQDQGANQDLSKARSSLQTLMKNLILARNDVDRIILNNSLVINDGVASNGTAIQITAATVEAMDRIFGAWALAQFPTTTVAAKSKKTAKGAADIAANLELAATASDLANTVATPNSSGFDQLTAATQGVLGLVKKISADTTIKAMSENCGYVVSVAALAPTFYSVATDMKQTLSDYNQGKDTTQDLVNLEKNAAPLLENSEKLLVAGLTVLVPVTGPATSASLIMIGIIDLGIKYVEYQNAQTDAKLAVQKLWKEYNKGQTSFKGNLNQTNPSVATPPDSVALCCFGAKGLGITGVSDGSGSFTIPVPLGITQTNYGSMTLTVSGSITGTIISTNIVNVSQTCANGATDYPTCTPPKCTNGATDYPTCTPPKCTNGATDYPTCTPPTDCLANYNTCLAAPACNPPSALITQSQCVNACISAYLACL